MSTRAAKAKAESSETAGAADRKPRAPPLHWDANPEWTDLAVKYLQQNTKFRLKLFSDSASDAKEEGRKKVSNGDGKTQLFNELAEAIFTDVSLELAVREDFGKDKARYARSLQQCFGRYKRRYGDYRRRFKGTGEGVLTGAKAKTLEAEITQEWSLYPDLHDLWSALPNYNPVGVSNSTPGQDHSSDAATLFAATGPSLLDDGSDEEDGQAEEDVAATKDGYDGGSSDFWEDEEAKLRADDLEHLAELEAASGATTPSSLSDSKNSKAPIKVSVKNTNEIKPSVKDSKDIKPSMKDSKPAKTNGASKKRPYGDSSDLEGLEEMHTLAMKEEAKRRDEKTKVRMLELEIQKGRQVLEQERVQAKREKLAFQREQLELERAQRAADQKRADKQFEMMMAAIGHRGLPQGGSGQQSYANGYVPQQMVGDLWLDRGDDFGGNTNGI